MFLLTFIVLSLYIATSVCIPVYAMRWWTARHGSGGVVRNRSVHFCLTKYTFITHPRGVVRVPLAVEVDGVEKNVEAGTHHHHRLVVGYGTVILGPPAPRKDLLVS